MKRHNNVTVYKYRAEKRDSKNKKIVHYLLYKGETLISKTGKELKEEMETIGEAEKSDRIVVLDAGHGGTDSGKVGINGVKEKDINLTITNSVKSLSAKNIK